MFTGSWLEGVTNIEQLYERIKGISPNEAILRLFNIIKPYEGRVPDGDGNELAVSKFYGEYFDFERMMDERNDDKTGRNSELGKEVLGKMSIAQMHSELEAAKK